MSGNVNYSDQPPQKRRRLDYTEEVVVVVGKDEKRITIHKNVLCSSSEFFKAACDGYWRESKEKSISLPEVKVDIFMIYVGWLYSGNLDVYKDEDPQDLFALPEQVRQDAGAAALFYTMEAYILGDFLDDKSFYNALTDRLITVSATSKVLPSTSIIENRWPKLHAGSSLRRLLVDLYVCYSARDIFDEDIEGYPREFLVEMLKALVPGTKGNMCKKDIPGRRPEFRERCYYHDHGDDEQGCLKDDGEATFASVFGLGSDKKV